MKTYSFLSNTELNKNEKYDFFIFAPHAGYNISWIPFIKSSLHKNHFSDTILYEYMKHEADIGSHEISEYIYKNLIQTFPHKKIALIIGEVPRAFCDLNRISQRAIPEMVQTNQWQELNLKGIHEIENIILNSHFGIHIHTMNGQNNTINWNFGQNVTETEMRTFLENGYSGQKRNDNILTKHANGSYHSYKQLDNYLIDIWQQHNIPLDHNIAYKFEHHFSATQLIAKTPSSLIEITKANLATHDTKYHINNSKIILDPQKIQLYGGFLSESISHFLQDNLS